MNRFESTNKVSILGILCNIFLLVIKASIGFFTNSLSMIADSFNSLTDVMSSFLTFIGNKIASKKEDDCHNFGHGKAEYIFSLLISIITLYLGISTLINSIKSFVFGNDIKYSNYLVIVSCITILTKFLLYIFVKKIYKKNRNLLIKANMNDHRNDCFMTIGTLIAVICSKYSISLFDSIVGCLISLVIIYTGCKIFSESYNILMDRSLDKKKKLLIRRFINKKYKHVEIEEMHTIPVGYIYMLILTIKVDGNIKTKDSHMIADKMENDIIDKYGFISKVLIHINPK